MKNKMKYIIRSRVNPNSILCTDGQFHAECFVGPGLSLSAKIYHQKAAAVKAAGRHCGEVEDSPHF